jgi:hypothetical protein
VQNSIFKIVNKAILFRLLILLLNFGLYFDEIKIRA